jgi:hypothetical protein
MFTATTRGSEVVGPGGEADGEAGEGGALDALGEGGGLADGRSDGSPSSGLEHEAAGRRNRRSATAAAVLIGPR